VSEQGPGCGARRLHFVGHQLLVGHAVGQRALALVQPLDPVGFEVDVAGNILDVLHVRPAGEGDGAMAPRQAPARPAQPAHPSPSALRPPASPSVPSCFTG